MKLGVITNGISRDLEHALKAMTIKGAYLSKASIDPITGYLGMGFGNVCRNSSGFLEIDDGMICCAS